jgi:hypothetical protein
MVLGFTAQLGGGLLVHSAPGEETNTDLWLPISESRLDSEHGPSEAAPPLARLWNGARGRQ